VQICHKLIPGTNSRPTEFALILV